MLPKNVWQYVVQIPRLAALGTRYVLQGGTQYNLAAVKAQVDYIKERVPGAQVFVHPHTGEAGAIGAAFETLRVIKRRGSSTFIGIRSDYRLDPAWPQVQAYLDGGPAPTFTYHRFWAQVDIALANAEYGRLFP